MSQLRLLPSTQVILTYQPRPTLLTHLNNLMDPVLLSSHMDPALLNSPMDLMLLSSHMDLKHLSSPMDLALLSSPMDLALLNSPMDLMLLSSPMDLALLNSPMDPMHLPSPVDLEIPRLLTVLNHLLTPRDLMLLKHPQIPRDPEKLAMLQKLPPSPPLQRPAQESLTKKRKITTMTRLIKRRLATDMAVATSMRKRRSQGPTRSLALAPTSPTAQRAPPTPQRILAPLQRQLPTLPRDTEFWIKEAQAGFLV